MPYWMSEFRGYPPDEVTLTLTPEGKMAIKDGGVTYAKLADDAKVKCKYTSGYSTVSSSSTVSLCSITVNANEFKSFYLVFAVITGYTSYPSYHDDYQRYFEMLLDKDGSIIKRVEFNARFNASNTIYYPKSGHCIIHKESDVTASHTFTLKIYNREDYTLDEKLDISKSNIQTR